MDSLIQDVRYAWRMMLKNRGFTLIVIMTMALGVGATSLEHQLTLVTRNVADFQR